MLAFLWRVVLFVLLGRALLFLLRALGSRPVARRRPPEAPPRWHPRRPTGRGEVIDAEFEDLGEGGR